MIKGDKKIVIAVGECDSARNDMAGALKCSSFITKILVDMGFSVEIFYVKKCFFDDAELIGKMILKLNPFCVFNLFEGFEGDSFKEAEFVKILEATNIPFTGNSSYSLNVCLDKMRAKQILESNGVPCPKGTFINNSSCINPEGLNLPLFIKPRCEDASLGIDEYSLVTEKKCLKKYLEKKLEEFSSGLLLEEFVPGNEYNVGFLGDFPYELVGISVLDYSKFSQFPSFLTYRSKWESCSKEFSEISPSVTEEIKGELKDKIVDLARKAGEVLKCRSYFRVDLRSNEKEELFVLDVNPNPDINSDGGFMRQAYCKGYGDGDIMGKILELSGCF